MKNIRMQYSKFGNTDWEISKIGLGTMTFGQQNSESQAHSMLDLSLDRGINIIDTAELYAVPSTKENSGKSEQFIGSWIKKTAKRTKYYISTKVTGPSKNLNYISNNLGFSEKRILEAVEGSLKRLQTDYIDIYQLHWPERNMNMFGQRGFNTENEKPWTNNFLEILRIMEKLIIDGKIRTWGVSNESPWGLMKFIALAEKHNLVKPVSIQNPYSLLNRIFEIGNAEISFRENIPIIAYSPLAFGLLSGKYHKKRSLKSSRLNQFKAMNRYSSKNAKNATQLYLQIADKYHLKMSQLSLAFVLQKKWLGSCIIGATTLDQLKENIESLHLNLDPQIISEIEMVHESIPNPAP